MEGKSKILRENSWYMKALLYKLLKHNNKVVYWKITVLKNIVDHNKISLVRESIVEEP